jgi:hypothetical protein
MIGYLNKILLPRKHDTLAVPVATAIEAEIADARRPFGEALTIALASSQQELERLELAAKNRKESYDEWMGQSLPTAMERFKDAFDKAYRLAEDDILNEVDPSPVGPLIAQRVKALEDSRLLAHALANRAQCEVDAIIGECDERLTRIAKRLEQRVAKAYLDVAREIGAVAPPVEMQDIRPDTPEVHGALPIQSRGSVFDLLRAGVVEGMLVMSVLGGIAAFAFPPTAIAISVSSCLGFAGGFARSVLNMGSGQRQNVLAQLRVVLSELVRRIQHSALRYFRQSAEDTRKRMERALRDAVQQRGKELRQALKDIGEQRRRSAEEARTKQGELRAQIKLLDAVSQSLRSALIDDKTAA